MSKVFMTHTPDGLFCFAELFDAKQSYEISCSILGECNFIDEGNGVTRVVVYNVTQGRITACEVREKATHL